MTVTVANLIPRVRKLLEDRPVEDYVASRVSDTSFTMTNTTLWEVGNTMEQPTGGQALIRTHATGAVTVKANHNDTTWGTVAANDVMKKEPRFTYDNISEAITRVIDGDLFPYAWKGVTTTITPDTTKNWYDLADAALGLIQVTQLDSGSPVSAMVYGSRQSGYPVSFRRNLPAALVTSGTGIAFPNGFFHVSNTVTVVYQALITTSDIDDGIMSDCVVYGAAAHLMEFKDAVRTGQDTTLSDQSVAPGATIRDAAWFRSRFEKKRAQLNSLCNTKFPVSG